MDGDLTGGADPTTDFVIPEPPRNPLRLEGSNMWVWDDAGKISLPRVAVDARGSTWDSERMIAVNLALPEGRVYLVRSNEPPLPPAGSDGQPRVIGGGPLRFECVEPYRHWRMQFEGTAVATNVEEQLSLATANPDAVTAEVVFEVEASMSVPAWLSGSLDALGNRPEGEVRYQQLCTAEGFVRIDGTEYALNGGGLRIHRKGGNRSDMSDWRGHCWQSALFPSGRAFGYCHYGPRPDGSVRYCEGFVHYAEQLVPARVVGTPWMTEMMPSGQDVSFALESKLGRVEIEAVTTMSTFSHGGPLDWLHQGIARYRWDGEEAYGMIERSYPGAKRAGEIGSA
jgi:hypothetical protein